MPMSVITKLVKGKELSYWIILQGQLLNPQTCIPLGQLIHSSGAITLMPHKTMC